MFKQTVLAGATSCGLLTAILFVHSASIASGGTQCVDWIDAALIPSRYNHSMAYDSARSVTVVFGGADIDGSPFSFHNDTWEWDGVRWAPRSPATSPPPRENPSMAYDSAREVSVLFGGDYYDGSYRNLNDTWEWNGTAWTQRNPASSPSARRGHAMAYDSARGVTVLFGGYDGVFLGDTWEWDGTTWTQRSSAANPSGRTGHKMAYDSTRGVAVLFGGSDNNGNFDDTWEWNGTTWMQRTLTIRPPPRANHSMSYDSTRGITVIFGGGDLWGFPIGDTWEWSGTSWVQQSPQMSPIARAGHTIAFDTTHSKTVLFGGVGEGNWNYLGDTWEWDGMAWSQRHPSMSPAARSGHAMAFDGTRSVSLLFGGAGVFSPFVLNDTWEWAGTAWTQRAPSVSPSPRDGHAMAYDSARGVILLFGGYDGSSYLDDTWEWGGTTWTQRAPSVSPTPRDGHAMAYDSARAVIILYGGYDGSSYLGDTWEWNGTTWVQRSSGTSPTARAFHAMTFDSMHSRSVLFGGWDGSDYAGDTWEWNGTTWTLLSPATSPLARWGHAMAYDAVRDKVVLFGGYVGNSFQNGETWEWSGITWTQRSSTTSPSARYLPAMAYDAARGVTVVFGGQGTYPRSDTWELRVPCLLDADLNSDCRPDGLDTFHFISSLLDASIIPYDLCHADFNANGVIDIGDVSGFVALLLGS